MAVDHTFLQELDTLLGEGFAILEGDGLWGSWEPAKVHFYYSYVEARFY